MANLFAVHRDPDLWTNPNEFEPERFLSEDGRYVRKDGLIPFGYGECKTGLIKVWRQLTCSVLIGKRSCPGESLANLEIFLYMTHFLQAYTVLPLDGHTMNVRAEVHGPSRVVDQSNKITFANRLGS